MRKYKKNLKNWVKNKKSEKIRKIREDKHKCGKFENLTEERKQNFCKFDNFFAPSKFVKVQKKWKNMKIREKILKNMKFKKVKNNTGRIFDNLTKFKKM